MMLENLNFKSKKVTVDGSEHEAPDSFFYFSSTQQTSYKSQKLMNIDLTGLRSDSERNKLQIKDKSAVK